MEQKSLVKMILAILLATVAIFFAIITLVPFLNNVLTVEVAQEHIPQVTKAPLPEVPEDMLVTAYYEMAEGSKKISGIYIEVYHVGNSMVSYMEVPVDTKVNLSEDLYKSLQTYAPELPQYLKLSNMAESFSTEYSLTGCNRILSEVLGVPLTEYVRADAEAMEEWLELQTKEKKDRDFFEAHTKWLENSTSSRSAEERWMYFESRKKVGTMTVETAPGSQEKDGYLLSGKRSRERLQEWMLHAEEVPQ